MRVFKIGKLQTILQIGILIMCFKTVLRQSAIIPYTDMVDNILTVVAVICLCTAILRKKYTLKMLIFYCMIAFVSLFSVMQTKNYGFLITIIVCLAIRGENLDKILTLIFKCQLFFLIINTSMAIMFAVLGNVSMIMRISGVDRYCFGFKHPNFFSIYLFNLLILWTWLNYENIKVKHILMMIILAIVAVYFTKTRTSFITTIIFCALILISKCNYSYKRMLNQVAKFIFPCSAVLTLICVKLYVAGNEMAIMINAMLSNRIKLGAYGILKFGYSFWGQDIDKYSVVWDSEWKLNNFTFDNLYIFLAVNQGLFWIILLSLLFYLLVKKGNLKLSVFVIIWALYGIAEVQGLNGFMCFPIFLITMLFNREKYLMREGI